MKIPTLLEGDYSPHFSTKNMLKDVLYSSELGRTSGVATPIAKKVGDQLACLKPEHQENDFSSTYLLQQQVTGKPSTLNLGPRTMLKVSGPDSVRFLNGQITNDVTLTDSGKSISACVLNMKGKMDAFIHLSQHEGAFYLETDISLRSLLFQRLDRYLIADDVELEDISDQFDLIHSPEDIDALHRIGSFTSSANRFGWDGLDIFVPSGNCEIESAPFAESQAEAARILNGIPKWPNELFPGLLPPEAGLEETAISYTKGCYTGQEVISRMKRAGKINRKLVKLTLNKPLIPTKAKLLVDGKEAGFITSVASLYPDQEIALGYLKRKFEDASVFQIASPYGGKIIGESKLR